MKLKQDNPLVRLFLTRDTWIAISLNCSFAIVFHISCNIAFMVNIDACHFAKKMNWIAVCMTAGVYFYYWVRRAFCNFHTELYFYYFKEIGVLIFGWCTVFLSSALMEIFVVYVFKNKF